MGREDTGWLWMTAAVLCSLLLIGCAANTPAPEDRYYSLPSVAVAERLPRPALNGVLAVRVYDSPAVYRDRALAYAETGKPNELRHFYFHHWADDPPTLLQHHLIEFLRTVGIAAQVVKDDSAADWDYLLLGRLKHFERVEGPDGNSVVVEIEFALERSGSRRALWVKSYRSTKPVSGGDVYPSVEAFVAALDEIYRQLAADLASRQS